MGTRESVADHNTTAKFAADNLRQIEELVHAELADADLFKQLLAALVAGLHGEVGSLWVRFESQLTCVAQHGDAIRHTKEETWQQFLLNSIMEGDVHLRELRQASPDTPPGYALLIPITDRGEVVAVAAVEVGDVESPATADRMTDWASAAAQLAANWFVVRRETHNSSALGDLSEFCRHIHGGLQLTPTAYAIANESLQAVGGDRFSVAIRHGNRFRVAAVSGQDVVERRANVVVGMQKLIDAVMKTGEPLWFDGQGDQLPEPIQTPLHAFLDESLSRTVGVLPLFRPADPTRRPEHPEQDSDLSHDDKQPPFAALVVEQIDDTTPTAVIRHRCEAVVPHAALALANAHQHERLFLLPLWRLLGRSRDLFTGKTLPKTLAVLACLTALLAGVLLIPTDFRLTAEGELQPSQRHDVFAPTEGVIENIFARHGDAITQGQLLLELRNPELEIQRQRVEGELSTAQKRLTAVQRARLDRSILRTDQQQRDLDGQALQLKEEVAGLLHQQELLAKRHEHLRVTSPVAGELVTFEVVDKLLERPVRTGDVLVTVANPNGGWQLDLYLPEDDIRYVTEALQQRQEPLPVSFVVAAEPQTQYEGQLREIHQAAELHSKHGHSVRLIVDFDEADVAQLRPGASVRAKIHCGRASIAYVWLHDVIEVVQRRLLF